MIVIIDTREQIPLTFSDAVQTQRAALPVGDYSIAGLEDQIVIERKSLSDLLGSITRGRERFEKELRQLRAFRFAALVIEANWAEITMKQYAPQVAPAAVLGSLMAFAVKYGVVPVLAEDHATAGELVERMLACYARMVERDAKALAGGKGAISAESASQ